MEKFPVILLSGIKKSGKDTFAECLCSEHYFVRCAFADYLKQLCSRILTNLGVELEVDMFTDQEKKEKTLLDRQGNPFVFTTKSGHKNMTARQFLQYFGSEIGRDMIHENIWITPVAELIKQVRNDKFEAAKGVVVTDCRFPNEYHVTKKLLEGENINLMSILIDRPGFPKTDLHVSETAMDGFPFDYVVKNDGEIEDLWSKANDIMNTFREISI